jgi:hypothetical protein
MFLTKKLLVKKDYIISMKAILLKNGIISRQQKLKRQQDQQSIDGTPTKKKNLSKVYIYALIFFSCDIFQKEIDPF